VRNGIGREFEVADGELLAIGTETHIHIVGLLGHRLPVP
jgi:hypothetical protein